MIEEQFASFFKASCANIFLSGAKGLIDPDVMDIYQSRRYLGGIGTIAGYKTAPEPRTINESKGQDLNEGFFIVEKRRSVQALVERRPFYSYESLNAPPSKVESVVVTRIGSKRPRSFSDDALVIVNEKDWVGPKTSANRAREKFSPSKKLCQFVMPGDDAIASAGDLETGNGSFSVASQAKVHEAKSRHVEQSLFGLLQTIADSRSLAQQLQPYLLSDGRRLTEPFAKAMLFRVQVGLFQSLEFLGELYIEMKESKISANNWKVETSEDGIMALHVTPKTQVSKEKKRRRAKTVKLRMAYDGE